MANEAGVVKSVTGGSVRALNNATGEVRNLSVGDIVYQNEKIITDSADSKVTITQTDGKEITLIGKDTITLDQDTNNNQTVADISALQQAILKGTDLNALEETAAGGPQAGGNGGDGVSLSSTSFAEGGHISNINANVGSIDALALAAGGDNSFGVSGGSAVGDAEVTPIIPPIATIKALGATNVTEEYDWQGPEYKFSLGDIDANGVNNLATRPTTYTFSLSGVEKGVDYDEASDPDGSYIFEYKDSYGDWVPMYGNKLTVNDPREIENLEIRIAALANNSIQNQGERVGDDPMFSGIDGAVQGVYQRKATVTVSSDNPQIASSSNTGTITETDDNISFTKGLDGKRIMTFVGDDTINLYGDIKNGSSIESGNDNDVINLYGNLTTGSTINTGDENIWSEVKRDIVNVKSGASINGATLASEGVATFNVEKGATLNNAHINHFGGSNQTVNVEGSLNETEMDLGTGNNKVTLDGATSTNKLRVETYSGNDDVVIKNSKILGDENLIGNHNVMNLRSGKNTVTVENSEISRIDIQANGNRPSDKTTVTLNATKGERLNINGQGEEDTFALKGGSTLDFSGVILGNGKNTIDVDGAKITNSTFITESDNDTINLKNAEMKNSTVNTGDGNDDVIIENSKILSPDQGHMNKINTGDGVDMVDIKGDSVLKFAEIYTGDGGDEVNIGGEFFASYAYTEKGDDIINVNGQIKGWSEIDAGEGGDEITINSGAKLYDGTSIYGNKGDDTITLKSGIEFIADRNGSLLDGGEGNDTFVIEKVADINKDYLDEAGNISGRVQINGDSGTDTLRIMDDSASLDFSKTNILGIERIEMGDASKNVTLSAKNILDITKYENSASHILDILGDGNDKVDLKGSGFNQLADYTDGNGKVWHQYSATNTDNTLNGISHTVTIRIEDGVTVDI